MKIKYFLILVLLSFIQFSCQDEYENETLNPDNSISKTATLATLLSRVSQNRTTFDNIIDGSSCFSIQLPVTITIDSHKIKIESEAEYKIVESIISESSSDDDDVKFSYPFTLIYRDYKSVIVNNKEEFETIKKKCVENQDFVEIDCVGINYPIVINAYDKNNQIAKTITIQSNSQLFDLLENLQDNIISIVYPLSMTNFKGENLTFNSNSELMIGIESAIGTCDDESGIGTELSDNITKGTWYVSYFLDENEDETAYYKNYNFMFASSGNVTATKNSSIINGTWNVNKKGDINRLSIKFDGSVLEDLDGNWIILNSNSTTIKLAHESDEGEDGMYYLTLSKN